MDTCGNCGARFAWNREDLLGCDCGHRLAAEESRAAPLAVVRMSRALASVAKGEAPEDLPVLIGLNVEQCVRVVRLLGTYGAHDGGCVPQKVPNVDRLEVSWPISSIAAEFLCTWPNGMTVLLDKLNQRGRDEDLGRLGKTFGGFYTALYKSFGAPEFEFLRTAFEGWVAEHWTGPLARRNRRLSSSVLEAVAWMPANYACRLLGVSRRRLASLIDEGRLRAGRRFSAAGREFVVVSKQDVEKLASVMHDGLTLQAAAQRLGLKRQRLAALLPDVCPEAKKLGERGCPWSIPTIWVMKWEELLRTQADSCSGVDGLVALGHVISYWPWTDDQVGLLLNDIAGTRLIPAGLARDGKGVGALLLDVDRTRAWFAQRQSAPAPEMTIPDVALKLEVKQEVAYSLVRSGLLPTNDRRVGRRAERRVSMRSLGDFQHRYVFCRDLARILARSPRSVASFLVREGVVPVAGPEVDGCRQLVFVRTDVEDCLTRHGIGGADRCQQEVARAASDGVGRATEQEVRG